MKCIKIACTLRKCLLHQNKNYFHNIKTDTFKKILTTTEDTDTLSKATREVDISF